MACVRGGGRVSPAADPPLLLLQRWAHPPAPGPLIPPPLPRHSSPLDLLLLQRLACPRLGGVTRHLGQRTPHLHTQRRRLFCTSGSAKRPQPGQTVISGPIPLGMSMAGQLPLALACASSSCSCCAASCAAVASRLPASCARCSVCCHSAGQRRAGAIIPAACRPQSTGASKTRKGWTVDGPQSASTGQIQQRKSDGTAPRREGWQGGREGGLAGQERKGEGVRTQCPPLCAVQRRPQLALLQRLLPGSFRRPPLSFQQASLRLQAHPEPPGWVIGSCCEPRHAWVRLCTPSSAVTADRQVRSAPLACSLPAPSPVRLLLPARPHAPWRPLPSVGPGPAAVGKRRGDRGSRACSEDRMREAIRCDH
jgi:hypothetical protein